MSKVASPFTDLGPKPMDHRVSQERSVLSIAQTARTSRPEGAQLPKRWSPSGTRMSRRPQPSGERILCGREYSRRRLAVDDGYSRRVRSARLAGIVEPLDEADQVDVEGPANELEFQKIQAAFA